MDALAPGHLIVVAVVAAVLFFGWRQLPDMSRSLGRSLRIFKAELGGMADDAAARSPQPLRPVPEHVGAASPVTVVTDEHH
jgi:sec-independent protein translocase protein TatA